jgi:uncharacterized protein (TIGR00661 family)
MTKKILIGICDIGMGHINRQTCIIKELLKYDVDILLTYTDNNKQILDNNFPNLAKVKINIPWIACDKNGIDFKKSLEISKNRKINYYNEFLKFCIDVEEYFGGKPDYVFTDYECNVASYSYAASVPLLGMDQHSKFLFLEEEKLGEYGIKEESSRLKFFFPKVDYRIISSFFPLPDIPNALLLPPIVDLNKQNVSDNNFVLAYFSPYVENKDFFEKMYNMMKNDKSNNYVLYTKFDFEQQDNIVVKPFSNDFKKDLRECKFVISTSGHQLISECIVFEKPLYLLPINTFEQHYSNLMVKRYNLGMDINDDYTYFINAVDTIKKNMIQYKEKYWKDNWNKLINDFFEKNLELKKKH